MTSPVDRLQREIERKLADLKPISDSALQCIINRKRPPKKD